jgi:short-subunit dehydrogenase
MIDGETRHIKNLVNTAGYFISKNLFEYTERDYDGYMDLNRAFFFVTQAVARNLVENGGGSIVNIASMWDNRRDPRCGRRCDGWSSLTL